MGPTAPFTIKIQLSAPFLVRKPKNFLNQDFKKVSLTFRALIFCNTLCALSAGCHSLSTLPWMRPWRYGAPEPNKSRNSKDTSLRADFGYWGGEKRKNFFSLLPSIQSLHPGQGTPVRENRIFCLHFNKICVMHQIYNFLNMCIKSYPCLCSIHKFQLYTLDMVVCNLLFLIF